jgi:hypothetical protein
LDPLSFAMVVVAVLAAANVTVPCGIVVASVAALPCAMVVVVAVHVDSFVKKMLVMFLKKKEKKTYQASQGPATAAATAAVTAPCGRTIVLA